VQWQTQNQMMVIFANGTTVATRLNAEANRILEVCS
jgi:hypothetical protein